MIRDRLSALEERFETELKLLEPESRAWRPCSGNEPDVLVIGAGQSGLAVAFALKRLGIENVLVVDRRPAGTEGPWRSFARMPTLRTYKHLVGPDLGFPSLTPRAWFEATHGPAAYDAITNIATADWADYLDWYRRLTGARVRNGLDVTGLVPDRDGVSVQFAGGVMRARHVVVANGMDGAGAWHVPDEVALALPRAAYAHTAEALDVEALRGRRVLVLGAGASAFDATLALGKAGATSVTMLARRPVTQRANPFIWMEQKGFLNFFHTLDDATRWSFARNFHQYGQPPTLASRQAAAAVDNVRLLEGARVAGWRWHEESVAADIESGETLVADFLVLGTGVTWALHLRPELAGLSPSVMLWRDRDGLDPVPSLGDQPYLGSHFELLEREPGCRPGLSRIRLFNFAALPSMGLSGSAISGLRYAVPHLAWGIGRDLYREQADAQLCSLEAFLRGDEVAPFRDGA